MRAKSVGAKSVGARVQDWRLRVELSSVHPPDNCVTAPSPKESKGVFFQKIGGSSQGLEHYTGESSRMD